MSELSRTTSPPVLSTGSPDLDRVLGGGLPYYASVLIAGRPGTGKTILSQQIGYAHVGRPGGRVLFLTALTEPKSKVIRNIQGFRFFDPAVFGVQVRYEEVGALLHDRTPAEAVGMVIRLVEEHRADLLVIDSFRAIVDLPAVAKAPRSFCHDLSEHLAFVRCTTLLVGEYDCSGLMLRPEAVVVDGVINLGMAAGPRGVIRTLRVRKLRGRAIDPRSYPLTIDEHGVSLRKGPLPGRHRNKSLLRARGAAQEGSGPGTVSRCFRKSDHDQGRSRYDPLDGMMVSLGTSH